jgi:neurotransmitter:Na+ symporter, NSS family
MIQNERESWQSKIGFIAAASGSAIGLGNIWRFPYLVGENGGAAFIILYLICIGIVGLPVMLAELSIGRAAGKNPFGAFRLLAPGTPWKHLGSLGIVTGFGILSFYSVVAGWTLGYLVQGINGRFTGPSAVENTSELFSSLVASPVFAVGLMSIFIMITGLVVLKGVQSGIERWSKLLMPILLVILLMLVVRSLTLPGAMTGLEFYLKPRFDQVTAGTLVDALGQALFSLSIGMGTMITYGSYLSKKDNMVSSSLWICVMDTTIAITAGLAIFPALFALGMEPNAGPPLVFIVFPSVLGLMPGGYWFGIGFFGLLAMAALTSTISLMEVVVAFTVEEFGWSRRRSVLYISLLCAALAIPSALSFGSVEFFSSLPGLGIPFLDLMSIVFGDFALAIGAFMIAIFAGRIWGITPALEELVLGNERFRGKGAWKFMILFVTPLAILTILINLVRTTFL